MGAWTEVKSRGQARNLGRLFSQSLSPWQVLKMTEETYRHSNPTCFPTGYPMAQLGRQSPEGKMQIHPGKMSQVALMVDLQHVNDSGYHYWVHDSGDPAVLSTRRQSAR